VRAPAHRCLGLAALIAAACSRAPFPPAAPADDAPAPEVDVEDATSRPFDSTGDAGVEPEPPEAGPIDADAGVLDLGPPDAGAPDAPESDVVVRDVSAPDVLAPDVPQVDAGIDVARPSDATIVVERPIESCVPMSSPIIDGPGRYALSGTTVGHADSHRGSCSDADAPDVGYPITLPSFSRVAWQVRSTVPFTFSPVVYITSGCAELGGRFANEVACGVSPLAGGGSTVDLPAGSYFLVVDGTRGPLMTPNAGSFEVALTVTAAEPSPAYAVQSLSGLPCTAIPMSRVALGAGDDVVSPALSLGFNFTYFGASFSRVALYSNGFFTFLGEAASPWPAATSWRNHALAFDGQPRGVVAPLWDDLTVDTTTGSNAYFWVAGTSPNRVAHVFWRDVAFKHEPITRVSFEARLYQTTHVIDFLYCGEGRSSAVSRGGSATVGIESMDQSAARLVGLNRVGTVAPNTGYRFIPR
jgi:hypothetical protein